MECIAIKTEPPEVEDIKPQVIIGGVNEAAVAEPARSVDNVKSRCGEIFVTNNARKWTFTCTYCEKTTRDIGEFICHIQFKHMNGQYTEECGNGDNLDELLPMETASTSNSSKHKQKNILFQTVTPTKTIDSTQTFPLSTPTIAQVSSLAITKNPLTFETSSNYEYSDSTNSGEELVANASTSQKHSNFSPSTTTQNTNKAKRKLDDEEDSNSVGKPNPTKENFEMFFVNYVKEGEENGTVIIDDDNDEMVDDEEEEEDEYIGVDDMEYNKLLCVKDESSAGDQAVSGGNSQQLRAIRMHGRAYCNLCDRYFQHHQHYRNHMIKHTQISPYKCQYCSKAFRSKQALRYHIKTHTKTNEYQCPICTVCYCTENQFITHVLIHESDTCFPCMVCGKILTSNEERDEHLKTHMEERPYGCHFCKRRFRQHNFLTNHLRKHCQYRCDFCPTDFHSMQAQRRPYACPQCEKFPDIRQKVESQRALSLKNQAVESDGDTEDENEMNATKSTNASLFVVNAETAFAEGSAVKPPETTYRIPCQYCPATFINNNNLIYHIHKKHGPERKYGVTDTESVKKNVAAQDDFEIYFVDENEDNGYVIVDDEENEEEFLDEDDDEVEFIGEDDMEYKQLLYLDGKPNVADDTAAIGGKQKKTKMLYCNECDKHFQRDGQYRSHMVKHRENTLFICRYCNKGFNSNQARNYHLKTHTKNDEYQCPICPLSYFTDNQFITHVLSHESNTCFPCMVCGKVCKSNEERDEHLKSHEQERPYGCSFCKRRFRKNNFLTNHLRKHCQYRCDFCPTDFHSTQAQRRPYVCPSCEKSPAIRKKVEEKRSLNVKNHAADSDIDTDDESEISVSKTADLSHRIRCKFCTATFVNKSNLLYHIKKKHGKKLHMLQVNN